MTRGRRLLAACALLLTALLLLPSPATAASNDVIRRLDIEIDIRPDGTLEVTETYDWDFGSRRGLGLTRVLDARFDYPPQPGTVRVYEYSDFTATSPSGAPSGVWVHDQGARVRADVGAPDGSDDRRSGRQTYVLRYTVTGALNAIRDDRDVPDQDELYWNATGHDWDIPIEQSSVAVTGPADVVDHACYQGGQGSTAECTTLTADGARVVGTSGRLDPRQGVTIMAAFPPGTFGAIEPILRDAPSTQLPWEREDSELAPVADFVRDNVAWLALLGLGGPVAYGLLRVRRGRDLHYVDLPPGVLPPPGSTPRVEQLGDEPVVAVRFTPPDGLRPGEVGAVDDKHSSTTHISATLIDLAVRGHLQIRELGTGWRGKPNNWLLVQTSPPAPADTLRDYEKTLLRKIFHGRRQVSMSQLRNTFAGTMRAARKELAGGIDARGLFTKPLRASGRRRSGATVVQAVVLGLVALHFMGGVSASLLSTTTFTLLLAVGLPVSALLVAAAVTRTASLQRTAAGRALHEQSRGFELYLSTAEAHQLRFEEGEDIFSRYLPYAMVYDVAERWAGILADLEAQGAQVARPTWYVGTHGNSSSTFRDLGSSLSSFSTTASSALSSTPGSSGGSGSRSGGGGGGSSGGGGGGGGGGGR